VRDNNKLGGMMIARKIALFSTSLMLAVASFVGVDTIVEYPNSGMRISDGQGRWRPLTVDEIGWCVRDEAIRSLGCALVVGVVLIGFAIWSARSLQHFRSPQAAFVGGLIGAAGGALTSVAFWMVGGGWGPPFLLPAIAEGAVLFSMIGGLAIRERIAKPDDEANLVQR
jgi:hypothetical protein